MKILKNLEIEWVTSAKFPVQEGAKAAINKEDEVDEPTKAELQKEFDDFKQEIVKEREETAAKLSKAADDLVAANKRIAELEKAADVEPAKKEIYKSLDGDVYVEGEERLAKSERRADLLQLEKEVATDYGHLTGEDSSKAAVLLLVKQFPEAERETAERMLKSGNEALARTTTTTRATMRKGEGESANEQIEKLAKERFSKDGISFSKAYTLTVDENPGLFQQAIQEGN